MHRLHKPGDEKRSVLDDDAWTDWLKAEREEDVCGLLQQFDPGEFRTVAYPKPSARGKSSSPANLFSDQSRSSA